MTHDLLLDEASVVSLSEIAAASGLSETEVSQLAELGVFESPTRPHAQATFPARAIELARAARRLRFDFELSLEGVALALAYRERILELERQLHALRCQLPGHARD